MQTSADLHSFLSAYPKIIQDSALSHERCGWDAFWE